MENLPGRYPGISGFVEMKISEVGGWRFRWIGFVTMNVLRFVHIELGI